MSETLTTPVPYIGEAPVSDTDAILSAIADVQATLNRYIELVEGMAAQVAPLMNSPMIKMFGGK
jgi:hypothetical protein